MKRSLFLFLCLCIPAAAGESGPRATENAPAQGDEIVVCGQRFHTGTKVVLWSDPGGYDAYSVKRRFPPRSEEEARARPVAKGSNAAERGTARYNSREALLTPEQVKKVHESGWDLPLLQDKVDQFVIHFDVCGTSRRCFEVLQDLRGLSVHFMLDIDGTIYQTLDLKERAWHATIANTRSVGIEIANMGAYRLNEKNPLAKWYEAGADGKMKLVIPPPVKEGDPVAAVSAGLHPARNERIVGEVQGQELVQCDFTPQQYAALAKLTATLCTVFPKIRCDYPRDENGKLLTHKLPDAQYREYHGVLGHYHVQTNKVDPGPAFQWDRVIGEARKLMPSK